MLNLPAVQFPRNSINFSGRQSAKLPVHTGHCLALVLGLHTHMAVVEPLRRATGKPLAVMDGRLITEMRTAAVSAVALDALGASDVRSLGILGSGVQAHAHIQALRKVRPSLEDIRVWSRTPANAERLAVKTGARVVTIREAAGADVVLTVTSSAVPGL